MARAWRIEYEGAYYHLLSRGNERQRIFFQVPIMQAFCETLLTPAVYSSQSRLIAGQNPAESHAPCMDKLRACQNPALRANTVKK
jgi:hypothetical protein